MSDDKNEDQGLDSDLPMEQTAPVAPVEEPAPATPAPTSELDFDLDSDMEHEQPDPTQAGTSFFEDEHWSSKTTQRAEPMVKDQPANFKPLALVAIPSMGNADLAKVTESLAPLAAQLPKEARQWLETVIASQNFLTDQDTFARSLSREGSSWTQAPEHDGTRLTAAVPNAAAPAPGAVLTGNDALIHLSQQLKTYARLNFPLFHSGIWLSINVPMGDELHTLEEMMAASKYDLGYMAKGLVYANTSVMTNIDFINFVLDRVAASSMENATVANLKKTIRVPDISIIACHLASAIYPSGFPLERPCSASPMTCHEITRGILRLSKLIWTDTNGLSVYQKKFLATRLAGRKKTEEELKRYQEEFPGVTQRVVEIGPGIRVRFLPPTIEQYEQSGYTWINQIESNANNLLTNMNREQLTAYMDNQYRLTTMRQYAHWVSEIMYPNDVSVVDVEAITASLAKMSGDPEVVDRFFKAVREFIEDCAVSVVAINNYSCPKCGKSQTSEASAHPKLIPLDAIHTFFTLSDLKIQTTLLKNMEH